MTVELSSLRLRPLRLSLGPGLSNEGSVLFSRTSSDESIPFRADGARTNNSSSPVAVRCTPRRVGGPRAEPVSSFGAFFSPSCCRLRPLRRWRASSGGASTLVGFGTMGGLWAGARMSNSSSPVAVLCTPRRDGGPLGAESFPGDSSETRRLPDLLVGRFGAKSRELSFFSSEDEYSSSESVRRMKPRLGSLISPEDDVEAVDLSPSESTSSATPRLTGGMLFSVIKGATARSGISFRVSCVFSVLLFPDLVGFSSFASRSVSPPCCHDVFSAAHMATPPIPELSIGGFCFTDMISEPKAILGMLFESFLAETAAGGCSTGSNGE